MKYSLFTLTFFALATHAQVRDTRANIEYTGRLSEMAVSPGEKIWILSALGEMFFADNIDSGWHDYKNVHVPFLKPIVNIAHGMLFFSKDTAVCTGYSYDDKGDMIGECYRTGDGGKSWEKREVLPYSKSLYCCDADKDGHAWITDWGGTIYFSKDFGATWESIGENSNCDRISGMCMTNPKEGIAYGGNKIYTTNNNWETHDFLMTPMDQCMCGDPSHERISKAKAWGRYIVASQEGHIYYTAKDYIDWKLLLGDVIDFEIDKDAQQLFAITKSSDVILFADPGQYRVISKRKLRNRDSFRWLMMQVVNHSLYIFWNEQTLYKVNADTFICTDLYTPDLKIKQPGIVRRTGSLCIGAEGNSIYCSDNNGKDWYREKELDVTIIDMYALTDSGVVIWDGNKNYLYSFAEHRLQEYAPKHPIGRFLKYPVKTISLQVSCEGHSSGRSEKVIYARKTGADSFSVSVERQPHNPHEFRSGMRDTISRHNIAVKQLTELLSYVNDYPTAIPSIADFHFSDEDKKRYLNGVEKMDDNYWHRRAMNKRLYENMPDHIDTITEETLRQALARESSMSSTFCTLAIDIINEHGDTLKLSNGNVGGAPPWHLPWQCRYNDIVFSNYSIGLSRFIKDCKPPENFASTIFDNSYLLRNIADYLYGR